VVEFVVTNHRQFGRRAPRRQLRNENRIFDKPHPQTETQRVDGGTTGVQNRVDRLGRAVTLEQPRPRGKLKPHQHSPTRRRHPVMPLVDLP